MQDAAVAMAEGDSNNDLKLDFEEFLAVVPRSARQLHSADEARSWAPRHHEPPFHHRLRRAMRT